MSRVINPNSTGKQRNQMVKAVAIAIRELVKEPEPSQHARDLAAFIALTLVAVQSTIDPSVTAWEKRGYWVKADRFRMEWAWSGAKSQKLRDALMADNWDEIPIILVEISQKVQHIKLPIRHRLGTPWEGAWERMLAEKELT